MVENIKTGISLRRELFEKGEAVASEMHVSRSRLFALALEEFIRRHENRKLLRRLNAAYSDGPDAAERALQGRMRRQHRRLVERDP
jgi:metal-responsive CopG/Arc/MetJ family transcriptional regulator